MTLWQVLLAGHPVDPLLDVLAGADPKSLAVMHGEARAGLILLGRGGPGTMNPARGTALVEDLRLLAIASLPWAPDGRLREAEVERLARAAFERVQGPPAMVDGRRLVKVGNMRRNA